MDLTLNSPAAVMFLCSLLLAVAVTGFEVQIDSAPRAVEYGQRWDINCSTTCPKPRFTLEGKRGEQRPNETNGDNWQTHSYSSASKWDLKYQCYVRCEGERKDQEIIVPVYNRDLNITPPPTLVENKQYSLECIGPRVYPNDRLILRWLKGNKTLQTESTKHPGLPDEDNRLKNVLNFNASKSHDGQSYTCVAEIDLGSNDTLKIQTSSITLQVNYAPTVAIHQTSKFWVEGKSQNISCNVEGNPAPQRVWTKDGKPLIGDEMLYIPSVHLDHAGLYTCTASNYYGSTNYSLIVTVQYKPRNTTISSDKSRPTSQSPIQISSGDNITLTCQSEASPLASYSWEYPNQSTDVQVLSSGVLFISNANSEHSGIYKCTARNHLGTDVQTSSITLQVNYKPRNTTISSDKSRPTSQSPIQISSGDNITLTCQSEASPLASYNWEYPNVTTDVKELSSGVLFVSNANSEHSGIYKCTARNHLGTDVQIVEIKIKGDICTICFIAGIIPIAIAIIVIVYCYWKR